MWVTQSQSDPLTFQDHPIPYPPIPNQPIPNQPLPNPTPQPAATHQIAWLAWFWLGLRSWSSSWSWSRSRKKHLKHLKQKLTKVRRIRVKNQNQDLAVWPRRSWGLASPQLRFSDSRICYYHSIQCEPFLPILLYWQLNQSPGQVTVSWD